MQNAHLSCSTEDTVSALADAEATCLSKGVRLTPIRRRVLELLLRASSPVKAYDLMDNLDGDGAAKPPTVYRALDFLLELGFAHKIESLNAFVACGHRDHRHAAAFLICLKCESTQELHATSTFAALEAESKNVGFKIDHAVVEVRGVCDACRAAA